MADSTLPPPGWYTDTLDPNLQRYWDGHDWTDDARPNPGPHLPPPQWPSAPPDDEWRVPALLLGFGSFAIAIIVSEIVERRWFDVPNDGRGVSVFVGLLVVGAIGTGIWLGSTAPERAAGFWAAAIAASAFAWGSAEYGEQDAAVIEFLLLGVLVFPAAGVIGLIGLGIGKRLRSAVPGLRLRSTSTTDDANIETKP